MGSIAESDKVQATKRVEDRIKGGFRPSTGLLCFLFLVLQFPTGFLRVGHITQ